MQLYVYYSSQVSIEHSSARLGNESCHNIIVISRSLSNGGSGHPIPPSRPIRSGLAEGWSHDLAPWPRRCDGCIIASFVAYTNVLKRVQALKFS
jgi:hypothetical protein